MRNSCFHKMAEFWASSWLQVAYDLTRGHFCALRCDFLSKQYCFQNTRGAATKLFWTSSGWKSATVALDRHEFRLGKTEVRLFLALERLFGHIRLRLRSILEDAGHIWREIEHKCKSQDRTIATLPEKRGGFASSAMDTKPTR